MSDKGLISKTFIKKLLNLDCKKSIKRDRGDEYTFFFQRRHIHGQWVHEKLHKSNTHQENVNQNYNVRMDIIKKTRNIKCWEGCG